MTRISSSSGKRSTISLIARSTIGPIVSASLRVGRTRLTVAPCLVLSAVNRPRSPNSEWWKFDSPNQRSTRAGTARTASAARSAAASVSARAASWSNVALAICSRVLTTMTVGFARAAIDSGSAPNRYGSPLDPNGLRRGAHHHEVRLLGFAQDRRPDVRRLAQERLAVPVQVLLHEGGQRVLRLGSHGGGDPRRDEVEDRHRRPVVRAIASAKRIASSACGPPRTGTRIRRIVVAPRCLTTAMSHGESRTTSSIVGENTAGAVAVAGVRRLAAPAEDHEVRLLLAGRLDDALGRPPADAHDGMDRRSFGREVENALEEPAGVPRPRRALRQRHPLGHLDDPERGQLAALVEDRRAELDQLLGGERVGDRDQDPRGERRAAHARTSAWAFFAGFPVQRSTRYGFRSSNSRAWRSTRSSACSVVIERFSMTKLPTRPK